jgi:hypothetical protein
MVVRWKLRPNWWKLLRRASLKVLFLFDTVDKPSLNFILVVLFLFFISSANLFLVILLLFHIQNMMLFNRVIVFLDNFVVVKIRVLHLILATAERAPAGKLL